jgi:magnesium transporter
MNFRFMPEIGWRFGYPFALALMLSAVLSMIYYFRKKGWWI